jgi:hypothetical protein
MIKVHLLKFLESKPVQLRISIYFRQGIIFIIQVFCQHYVGVLQILTYDFIITS